MAQSKVAKGEKPATATTSFDRAIPRHRSSRSRGRVGSALRRVNAILPVAALIAPVLVFVFYAPVHDRALSALGYGLAPVALWVGCFALAVRYKRAWVRRFWRGWLGSAISVAIALAILSMFNASSGVMQDASFGGNWGQYLGGKPTALGSLKVVALILLSPLLLYPRRSGRVYRRVGDHVFGFLATGSKLLTIQLASRVQAMVARPSSGEPQDQPRGTLMRKASISSKKSWRSMFGVPSQPQPDAPLKEVEADEEPKAVEVVEPKQEVVHKNKDLGWQLPSLELLGRGEDHPVPPAALQEIAQHIEDTLADHRVEVAVEDIRAGPRVIRFGLVPGWIKKYREAKGAKARSSDSPPVEISRVTVQSILVREKDLALALKTPYLRLEAPVPGESLVGLEMPSPYPRRVVLRSMAESPTFQKIAAKGGLPVALGEDTAGEPVVADLSELPHLLIAGATGSGKSVCINSVVASLLLTSKPDKLRMLMVDPKRVELTPFNGIPHLISPVIVDTDQVLVVLKAVQNEMLRRYKLMEEVGVRNLEGYNKKAKDQIPALVIIIDELADLMMAAAYEVEQGLVRLAQLGRATGIHLILATQRPSVNVVTGLLKANVPARIAFAVASQVDSRVILDSVGAEKLLGKGDMLLLTSDSPKPKRVQGTFVHDREIEKLVEFWKIQSGPQLAEIPLDEDAYSASEEDEDYGDDILDRARELAERYQQLSPSVLQRRLQIGYPRAVELIEHLKDEGLITSSLEFTGGPGRS